MREFGSWALPYLMLLASLATVVLIVSKAGV